MIIKMEKPGSWNYAKVLKYLTEKYLHGQIAFTSSEKEGTTFTATYPLGLSSTNTSTTK